MAFTSFSKVNQRLINLSPEGKGTKDCGTQNKYPGLTL